MAVSKNLQLLLQLPLERSVAGQASRRQLADCGRLAARDTEWSLQLCLALAEPRPLWAEVQPLAAQEEQEKHGAALQEQV